MITYVCYVFVSLWRALQWKAFVYYIKIVRELEVVKNQFRKMKLKFWKKCLAKCYLFFFSFDHRNFSCKAVLMVFWIKWVYVLFRKWYFVDLFQAVIILIESSRQRRYITTDESSKIVVYFYFFFSTKIFESVKSD